MSTVAYPHVEIRSDGVPVIAGTGFKVRMLVEMHVLGGEAIDELLREYPRLTAAGIHGALSYYYDHKDQLDREIIEGRQLAEKMMAADKDSPLQRKMRELGW